MNKKLLFVLYFFLAVGILNADSITKAAAGKDIKAVLVVKSLQDLFTNIGSVTEKFSPGSSAIVEQKTGLHIFGDPMMKGIDRSKPIVMGFLTPEDASNLPGYLCLPLSNAEAFSASSKTHFEKNGSQVTIIKGYAVICKNKKQEVDLLKSVSAQLTAVKPADVDALAVAYIPMDSVSDHLDNAQKEMKEKMLEKLPPDSHARQKSEVISLQVAYLFDLIRQIHSVRTRFSIGTNGLSLSCTVEPLEKSKFEQFLLKSREKNFSLMGLDTQDTICSGVINISPDLCREFFLDMIIKDMRDKKLFTESEQKKITDIYNQYLSVITGLHYFKLIGTPGNTLSVVNILKIKDKSRARKMVSSGIEWYKDSEVKNFSNSPHMQVGEIKFTRDSRSSGSVPVDSMNVKLKYSETMQLLEKFYGAELNYEFSYLDNFIVIAQAEKVKNITNFALKQLQTLTKKPLQPREDLPSSGLFLVTTNLINFIKFISQIIPVPEGGDTAMLFAMGKGLIMGLSCDEVITLTGKKSGKSLVVTEFIPYSPFLKAFHTVQNMFKGPQPGGGGDAPPPPQ